MCGSRSASHALAGLDLLLNRKKTQKGQKRSATGVEPVTLGWAHLPTIIGNLELIYFIKIDFSLF